VCYTERNKIWSRMQKFTTTVYENVDHHVQFCNADIERKKCVVNTRMKLCDKIFGYMKEWDK